MLVNIRDNLSRNLQRVENLVKTYETHPDAKGTGRKSAELHDILRAAVVLLHASLEDVLRNIARWKLPNASADTLNNIPLVGLGPNPKKFLLGDLTKFKGKTINEVFSESVAAHLDQSNYNNPDDIATLLTGIGINASKMSSTFPKLGALMARRHQIVHRADRQDKATGPGHHMVRSISRGTVRTWIGEVREFSRLLFREL